jgi:ribonuclease Z
MIKVVILGAGTAIPVPGYSPAGTVVQLDGELLLFDIGPGTLARLAIAGFDYREIDMVFLTHHHPDHTLDLVTLFQTYDSTPGWSRRKPLSLVGCRGTAHFYEQLMMIYPDIGPSTYRLEIFELGEETLAFEEWRVKTVLTGHTATSLAYRLEAQDKSIVFSGDATFTPGLINLAHLADVFVCESSFPGEMPAPDHLTAQQAGWIAQQAGVGSLVLVHLYPPAQVADLLSQIRKNYAGPVEVAYDGLTLLL